MCRLKILHGLTYFHGGATGSRCGGRSEVVFARLKFLKLLSKRGYILHHVVEINSIDLVVSRFVLQILENRHLLIKNTLCFKFHACRSHNLHVAIPFTCFLSLLPPLIRLNVILLPLLLYFINLLVVIL